ncbi:MAG: PEP-CTERM sorting domain-containing protein [Rhodobacterales bacterium]|nr:PEP-CTERM sorting domain-containing protein [Rhodobacterales bacterium]
MSNPAAAVITYDDNVTPDVIFGSGNANGGFTTDRANDIELGLRGKLRHNAAGAPENTFNSNGDGTYSFNAGVAPTQSFPTAEWSFEWSINSDTTAAPGQGRSLGDLTYQLSLDIDPGAGTNFVFFDPINDVNPGVGLVLWDHAMGDNTTANGGGVSAASEAEYAQFLDEKNVAQNSWKPHWYFPVFDPTVDGVYDIMLTASSAAAGELARTRIQIIVGAGAVPTPGTLALFGAGLLGLAWNRRRRAKA